MKNGLADPWCGLRRYTPARIALGRSGTSLPTQELLRFGVAHAQARDAVHLPFDAAVVRCELGSLGFETIEVESAAPDRATYLRRPDLGRRLSERSRALLRPARSPPCGVRPPEGEQGNSGAALRFLESDVAQGTPSLVFVVADGLSSKAVHAHAAAVLREARTLLEGSALAIGPIVLAHQARVALGDDIGACLGAEAVAVLIGERPGLSSPDSLGIYLTWQPRVGRTDAERNCISNIRPEGLAYAEAARKLAWLFGAARRVGATGVALKDESEGSRKELR